MASQEKELEIYGPSGNVTPEGRPMYFNNFGGESSENTIGVIDQRINKNALTHIPSIYDGRILNEKDAIQRVVDANGHDPITGRFIEPGGDPSARSKSLDGKYMGMQGGFNTRREQPQQTRRKIMPFNQGGMNGGMQGGMPGGMQGGMTGGMFGPPGGSQNFDAVGIGSGGPTMTDQELQAMLGMLQSQSPTGGALPIYDMPAQLPQGTPSLGTGIDPSMMAGVPPAPPMDFGVQDIAGGMQGTQQGLMNIGMAERRRRLALAAQGGSAMGGGGYMNTPGMQGPRLPSGGV
jgi:hypothetical protein